MRSILRSFFFSLAAMLSAGAMAQFPYTLIVQGSVTGCTPFQQVTVSTTGGTSPSVSYTLEIFPPNCTYDTIIQLNSTYAGVMVSTLCNGMVVTASDSTTFTFLNDTAVIVIDLNCGGGILDCTGTLNGPNMPGTACNDNDPNTINDLWSPNCDCIGAVIPPSSVYVTGTVAPCTGGSYPVHIFSDLGTTPYIDTVIATGPNCTYEFLFSPVNTSGWVNVEVSCDSGLTWQWDSLGFTSTPGDTLVIDFTCGGMLTDCLGIPGGPNMPGTACSDNNPNTINDTWSTACTCVGTPLPPSCQADFGIWQPSPWVMGLSNASSGMSPMLFNWLLPDGSMTTANNPSFTFNAPGIYGVCLTITTADSCTSTTCDTVFVDTSGTITTSPINFDCLGIPGGSNLPGTACNDGDTLTVQDTWTPTCQCIGVPVNYYDCLQLVNGPNLPGTPCNDNNPATIGDTWDANCVCMGNVPQPCNADFWVLQAYTVDSITNLPTPTPNLLWIWNLSSGGSGAFQFQWNFGDGTSSTDPFPTHTYANGGPYLLCLTINDSLGCSDTYCDSVSVDANGLYTGMLAVGTDRAAGFSINVRDPLATGITEALISEDGLTLWPNPATDELNIALTNALSGTIEVQVMDLNGRLVRNERRSLMNGRNQLQLSTADLDAGLYLLRMGNGKTTISRRFVKAN